MSVLLALAASVAPMPCAGQDPVRSPSATDPAPLGPARSVVQTPHGELLVVLENGRVEFLDSETGASRATFRPRRAAGNGAAVSPNFEHIALRDANDRVRILPLGLDETTDPAAVRWATRRSTVVFSVHKRAYGYAATQQWTGDGKHLVTWGEQRYHTDSTTPPEIWTATGERVWTGPIACDVAVHPTENRIALVRANEVEIGWPESGFETVELSGAFGVIEYEPSGERLAVGGTKNRIGDAEGETPPARSHPRESPSPHA